MVLADGCRVCRRRQPDHGLHAGPSPDRDRSRCRAGATTPPGHPVGYGAQHPPSPRSLGGEWRAHSHRVREAAGSVAGQPGRAHGGPAWLPCPACYLWSAWSEPVAPAMLGAASRDCRRRDRRSAIWSHWSFPCRVDRGRPTDRTVRRCRPWRWSAPGRRAVCRCGLPRRVDRCHPTDRTVPRCRPRRWSAPARRRCVGGGYRAGWIGVIPGVDPSRWSWDRPGDRVVPPGRPAGRSVGWLGGFEVRVGWAGPRVRGSRAGRSAMLAVGASGRTTPRPAWRDPRLRCPARGALCRGTVSSVGCMAVLSLAVWTA